MPQLTRGAREALDQVDGHFAAVRDELERGRAKVKGNPGYAEDRIDDALRLAEDVIHGKVAALLERQAPEYERRLAELEQRIAALEAGSVVRLIREKTG